LTVKGHQLTLRSNIYVKCNTTDTVSLSLKGFTFRLRQYTVVMYKYDTLTHTPYVQRETFFHTGNKLLVFWTLRACTNTHYRVTCAHVQQEYNNINICQTFLRYQRLPVLSTTLIEVAGEDRDWFPPHFPRNLYSPLPFL